MTALVWILSYVRVSGISIYTTNLPQNLSWKSIRISPVVLLDIENIGINIGILLLSRIHAEIYAILYPLPVTGRHLWFLTHPVTRQCLDQSSHVAWHQKHKYSCLNFVAILHTSWDICYFISTFGYRPPCLISHSLLTLQKSGCCSRVFVLCNFCCGSSVNVIILCLCSPTKADFIRAKYQFLAFVNKHKDSEVSLDDLNKVWLCYCFIMCC